MKTLEWSDGQLLLIDQSRLPAETVAVHCSNHEDVAVAIETMKIRGAPAIGLAAAYGVALAALMLCREPRDTFQSGLETAMERLGSTRPTAVNLFWAIERTRGVVRAHENDRPVAIAAALLAEADRMVREDEEANRRMGAFGAELIPDGANILTHCNAGALATGEYGTALGVIRAAHESGKRLHVWVDETRPLLQGARLTAWELRGAGIPHTLITDNMAGHFMARGTIDLAVVGADRIAANGDTANKIGTYSVAVLAHEHGLPFFVAAPTSTVDLAVESGAQIPIEERKPGEVTSFGGYETAPEGTQVANPAFDVTPARYISAIITEQGVVRAPFRSHLAQMIEHSPCGG